MRSLAASEGDTRRGIRHVFLTLLAEGTEHHWSPLVVLIFCPDRDDPSGWRWTGDDMVKIDLGNARQIGPGQRSWADGRFPEPP